MPTTIGQGAAAGVEAKSIYGARLWVGVLTGGGGHAQAGNPELGFNGARALRKYACDANAIWETVRVSAKPRRMATISGIESHERAKNDIISLEGKTVDKRSR
eukprot:6183595-Pleurochrysis_carterae.AAC.2